jgi:hypothetical protein
LLNANSSLEYSIDLIPQIFKSDNGLIFQDEKIYEGFEPKIRVFYKNTKSDLIAKFYCQGNQEATVFLRNYIKLQSVITQIGGFIQAIMIVANFISYIFSKNYFFIQNLIHIFEEDKIVDEKSKVDPISTFQN